VTTLHGRLDLPDLASFYRVFPQLLLVSISNNQLNYLRNVNWVGTVRTSAPASFIRAEDIRQLSRFPRLDFPMRCLVLCQRSPQVAGLGKLYCDFGATIQVLNVRIKGAI
jgi:hypothetical protein